MTVLLPIPAVSDLPADLQEALARVFGTARKYSDTEVHALRAALNIALTYVREPEVVQPELELVFMFADDVIAAPRTPTTWDKRDATIIQAETVYMVCPHCITVTDPEHYERGVEGRNAWWNDEHPLVPSLDVGDSRDFVCEDSWFECDTCGGRLSLPDWLEPDWV